MSLPFLPLMTEESLVLLLFLLGVQGCVFSSKTQLLEYFMYFYGIIILSNELNNIIRMILKAIQIGPAAEERKGAPGNGGTQDADMKEFNRGKIIGIIERVLIYSFTIIGAYGSIGFILAAKGIARFKELDKRDFSEYFLIGTLLSSSLSLMVGYIIKSSIAHI